MKIEKYLIKQLQEITSLLIKSSFATSYNFPTEKNGIIVWENFKNISFALKNQPYQNLFHECIKERAYNYILIDGALIQIMYECKNNLMIKHRLAFYPNPNFERFQDSPEDYEDTYYGHELFTEISEKNVITFPIRFDFDNDPNKYEEHDHSYVHASLGNYKNCRIPISRPITPNKFILFILRSFYFDKFKQHFTNDSFKCNLSMEEYVTVDESKFIHINH